MSSYASYLPHLTSTVYSLTACFKNQPNIHQTDTQIFLLVLTAICWTHFRLHSFKTFCHETKHVINKPRSNGAYPSGQGQGRLHLCRLKEKENDKGIPRRYQNPGVKRIQLQFMDQWGRGLGVWRRRGGAKLSSCRPICVCTSSL